MMEMVSYHTMLIGLIVGIILTRHHKMPSSLHYDIITAKNSLGGRDTLL